jgi:hypothetical protein
MNRLKSRRNLGRFTPRVEALEDRSLLNATVIGQPFGTIATTGAVNQVVITDDGQFIRVFSDNGFVASFTEGTALTVKTIKTGSANSVFYDLLGFSSSGPNRTLFSSLDVNFGSGNGTLVVTVTSSLPNGLFAPGPVSNLIDNSNVQISTTTTAPPAGKIAGNTREFLSVGSIGTNAILSLFDNGGAGNDFYQAQLFGVQKSGSTVALTFFGNAGNDTALVFDGQDIQGTTNIGLHGGPGNDTGQVLYSGQLTGSLSVTDDGGPGVDKLFLRYELASGSNGTLSSQQNGGPDNETGAAALVHIIHKQSGDNPNIFAALTNGGPGTNTAFVTRALTSTSVFVIVVNAAVVPVF